MNSQPTWKELSWGEEAVLSFPCAPGSGFLDAGPVFCILFSTLFKLIVV